MHLKPLALALAAAAGASFAADRTPWPGPATTRPDGSILWAPCRSTVNGTACWRD